MIAEQQEHTSSRCALPPAELLPGTPELVTHLAEALSARAVSTRQLDAAGARFLGGGLASGRYDARYLYDAVETALHLVLAQTVARQAMASDDPVAALQSSIAPLLERLPRQRRRTHEQSLLQQYSTPATLAFLAARALCLNGSEEIVLEPSAGTGALALFPHAFGARVLTNEVSSTRRTFLRLLGFESSSVDAEFLDDLLDQTVRPSAILMNPPFSSTGGRVARNNTNFGARHIETALRRCQPNGRLVAIAGGGMAIERSKFADWWDRLSQSYNVRANISLPTAMFSVTGTTFDTQLIVIDKTGATPGDAFAERLTNIRYGKVEDIAAAFALLADLPRRATALIAPSKESPVTVTTVDSATKPAPSAQSASAELSVTADNAVTDEADGFAPYVPARLTGGANHPARLVEVDSMAAVLPPPIRYRPRFDPAIVVDGKLSTVQLERVCYAGQRHEQRLANGARGGFLLADSTGVGKSRTLAGIILDNFNQGRRKALWLSVSNQLLSATRLALTDLGANIPLQVLNEYDAGEAIEVKEGIVFATYNTLIACSKSGATRLEQILQWLGSEGVVIFDECQRAQNALAAGKLGKPTQSGQAVITLQDADLYPDMRVIYSSATSVTDVRHMAYMTRLGLWGPGTAFPSGFHEFMDEIEEGGVGSMEMVSRSLKALGIYMCAALSYGPDPVSNVPVEYQEVFHELSPAEEAIYNIAASAWQVVLKNVDEALGVTNSGPRARAQAKSSFWGYHQRFFRQLITAFKVPTVIRDTEASLANNESVVISLIGTAEAKSKQLVARAIADGDRLDNLDFSPRATLCAMVERTFPVKLYKEVTDPRTEQTTYVPVMDGDKHVESAEALRMRAELLERLSDLTLPDNPLDQLVNHFGPDNVAEITGRKKRLSRDPKTGELKYVTRAPRGVPMSQVNDYEVNQFQSGLKRIAVISAAGSQGLSLHSSLEVTNQQRRHHIVLELSWSAVLQIQSFGRTHRSAARISPRYSLVSTNLGGERRFSATIARRLGSMGALCRGDRNAADGGSQLAKYAFESMEGRAALELLYRRILQGEQVPGLDHPLRALADMGIISRDGKSFGAVGESDISNVPRFLNRILSLPMQSQNALFDYYYELFGYCLQSAKDNGTFDDGVQDIRAVSVQLACAPSVVHVDKVTAAETLHYTLQVEMIAHRISFDRARALQAQRGGEFYRHIKKGNFVLAIPAGSRTDTDSGATNRNFAITRPEGVRLKYIPETEMARYRVVKPDTARRWWNAHFNGLATLHTTEMHLISGAILPIWQRLKTAKQARLRVVRVVTQEGKRIVGVQIPAQNVRLVLRALGLCKRITDPSDIYSAIIDQNDQFMLTNGMSLVRARLSNEQCVELRGALSYRFAELRDLGLIDITQDYRHRFYIPTEAPSNVEFLSQVLQRYPLTGDEEETVEQPALPEHLDQLAYAGSIDIYDLMRIPRSSAPPSVAETVQASSPNAGSAGTSEGAPSSDTPTSTQITLWELLESQRAA